MSEEQRMPVAGAAAPGAVTLVERLEAYSGPVEGFLAHLLVVQCETAPAVSAAVVRPEKDSMQVLAIHPAPVEGEQPDWLRTCVAPAARVVATGRSEVVPVHEAQHLYGQPPKRLAVIVPLRRGPQGTAAVFLVPGQDARLLQARQDHLELTGALLAVYEMRHAFERRSRDVGRMRAAMEMLSVVNDQNRFKGAAMAFCNEVVARWKCERAAFGILKGRYVHLKALSPTEKFSRKMKLVQDVESAMEECIDQDVEVMVPGSTEATCISRAAGELSRGHGLTAVVSLPLRQGGEPVGVVTVERPYDEPFETEDVESLRLACDLATPRLMNLFKHDRWFGARLAGAAGSGLGVLVGRKHTWAKLAAVGVLAAALFLVFAEGDYEAKAPFVVEAVELRVIPAPFDGFIGDVRKEPGDLVKAGEVLAVMDTSELRMQVAAKLAERDGYRKEADAARTEEKKEAQAQIADAKAARVTAEIDLLNDRIAKAEIRSELAGTVVSGDMKKKVGAPVKTGEQLFEVAPLASLRAVLSVPEDLIADVREADAKAEKQGKRAEGELAAASRPDVHVPFRLDRISPVAEVVNQKNVFKVRVALLNTPEAATGLSIGTEGAARIHIDRRRYAWIWSRRLVNWIRMKLWF
ncbi:MAG TPA: HlyD family efflux transporter periplasmic adaptor subunit [Planctomycetota bacterium]|nr:HlyD family efflux transporter periplasmic adaptor subunit [Planctomycetota bacterium]